MKNLSAKLQEIINTAVSTGNRDAALDIVNSYDLSMFEYDMAKAHVNTHFMSKPVTKSLPSDVVQWTWFEEDELPEFNWSCSKLGLIPGPISILSAFSNTGKTFFAASLAIAFANGVKFLGSIDIERPGKVLHIDYDQSQKFSQIYYWRMLNGYGIKSFNNIHYSKPDWYLNSPEAKENLLDMLKGYSLCIIDCLGAAIPGEDINDDRVRRYIDMLNDISEKTDCAILLLHHEPKMANKDPLKSVKGNGSIISAAGGSLHLTRSDATKAITMTIGKKRFVQDFEVTYMLEDCGEMSKKLNMKSGLVLNPITSERVEEANVDLPTEMLEFIKTNPGCNGTALRNHFKGNRGQLVDQTANDLHEADLITITGIKPKVHKITEAGLTRLSYK